MSNQGLVSLMNQVKYKEINYLYKVLQRINKAGFIKKGWKNYIQVKGQALINTSNIGISKIIIFKEEMD